jgi:hypothetical protein
MDDDQLRQFLPDLTNSERNRVIATVMESVWEFPQRLAQANSPRARNDWHTAAEWFMGATIDAGAGVYLSHYRSLADFRECYLRIARFAMIATSASGLLPKTYAQQLQVAMDWYCGTAVLEMGLAGVSAGIVVARVVDDRWRHWQAQLLKGRRPPPPVALRKSVTRVTWK